MTHIYDELRMKINHLDPKHEHSEDWPEIPQNEQWRYESDGLNEFDIPDMEAELIFLQAEGRLE